MNNVVSCEDSCLDANNDRLGVIAFDLDGNDVIDQNKCDGTANTTGVKAPSIADKS